jgi:hypothetical protein
MAVTQADLALDQESEGALWDARSEVDVAVLVNRYLLENPAPDDAEMPAELQRWAGRLAAHGRVRLRALGRGSTLRAV